MCIHTHPQMFSLLFLKAYYIYKSYHTYFKHLLFSFGTFKLLFIALQIYFLWKNILTKHQVQSMYGDTETQGVKNNWTQTVK